MDSLSAVLREIRLQGSVHFNTCFQTPWGLNVEKDTIASFHLVVSGRCWLTVKGLDGITEVGPGDAVILPQGTEHQLYDVCPSHCVPAFPVVEQIKLGNNPFAGEKPEFNIVCGFFSFERDERHTLVKSLPKLIHITQSQRQDFEWLDTAMQLLVCESATDLPGKSCFIDRVTELFFIQINRLHINKNKDKNNYFAALGDKKLSIAIQVMHEQPECPWTLDSLAKKCGMSRARFSERFKQLVGMTPLAYLTGCRMLKAKRLIGETDAPLYVIGEQVGYQSDSAFKAAFKKFYDKTPASFRQL